MPADSKSTTCMRGILFQEPADSHSDEFEAKDDEDHSEAAEQAPLSPLRC
jgi:hypothetical protein